MKKKILILVAMWAVAAVPWVFSVFGKHFHHTDKRNVVWIWMSQSGNGGFTSAANSNFYYTNLEGKFTNDMRWPSNAMNRVIYYQGTNDEADWELTRRRGGAEKTN